MKKFYKDWFNEKWKDPVWSKVIAAPIIGIGALIWNLLDAKGFVNFINLIYSGLTYTVSFKIWLGLLVIAVVWLFSKVIKHLKRKGPVVIERNHCLDRKIGNHSFEELYNILKVQRLRKQTSEMELCHMPAPEDTLFQQFLDNYHDFRKGVSFGDEMALRARGVVKRNDGGYMFELLAPALVDFQLLTIAESKPYINGAFRKVITFKVSDIGYDFYDCVQTVYPMPAQSIYRS